MAAPITPSSASRRTTPAATPWRTKRPSAATAATAVNRGQVLREWVRMPGSSKKAPACDRRLGRSRSHRAGSCELAREMPDADVTDDQLLSARDAASFELFYTRHVHAVLGFFARRTGDPELAADLCAETFAAALAGRHRYRPEAGAAAAWLYGIATKKLADAQRRGYAERRARRRLGMERIELSDDDIARIECLGEGDE